MSSTTLRTPPTGRWTIFAGLALLLVGPLCFLQIADFDVGWHLALGRLIAGGEFPTSNALTWTARDTPWYDGYWLWNWVTFLLTARFGLVGLQAATLVVLALALLALGWSCAHADPERGAWLVPAFALLLVPRLVVRPHVAAWASLSAVLALCLAGQRRSPRWRLLCLPLIALAGNLHPGAIFSAAVLGFFCVQEFAQLRSPRELGIAALGVLALCLNPGGTWELHSMIFHLDVQSVVVIGEYLPPEPAREPVFYALLPIALVFAWRRRAESPALLALLVAFGALGLRAVRMVYEFQLIAAPVIAFGLLEWRARLSARAQAGLALVLALLCGASHRWDRKLHDHTLAPSWDPAALPVRAIDFARAQRLEGKLFNAYDHGGYIEWALPEVPAFVDGRVQCFPPAFFRRFYAAGHGPELFQRFLREEGVEWAITLRTSPWLSGRGLLDGSEAWAMVYWDDQVQLYLRRDLPRFAPAIAALEYRRFRPVGPVVGGIAAASREGLAETLAEVERYERTTSGDPMAALVRCAVQTRRAHPAASADCARARALATDDRLRALVAKAEAIAVAP